MRNDKYRNFGELSAVERVGIDFGVRVLLRDSPVAILAPHGGTIEPGTSEIATAIVGADYNLYCFEGMGRTPHWHLHITSTLFDEPQCLALVEACDIAIAIHGLVGDDSRIDLGGLDIALRDRACGNLQAAGFQTRIVESGSHAAISPDNICNKGRKGAGVNWKSPVLSGTPW